MKGGVDGSQGAGRRQRRGSSQSVRSTRATGHQGATWGAIDRFEARQDMLPCVIARAGLGGGNESNGHTRLIDFGGGDVLVAVGVVCGNVSTTLGPPSVTRGAAKAWAPLAWLLG